MNECAEAQEASGDFREITVRQGFKLLDWGLTRVLKIKKLRNAKAFNVLNIILNFLGLF